MYMIYFQMKFYMFISNASIFTGIYLESIRKNAML
jgi:hypothetical protein